MCSSDLTSADVGMSIQNGTANYASYLSLLGSNVTGTAYNNISCGDGTTTHWQIGGFGTAYSLAFRTNGANERMRIDSSGNVGIGTTTPNRALEVFNTGPQLRLSANSTWYSEIYTSATDGMLHLNSTGSRVTIDTQYLDVTAGTILLGGLGFE